MHHCVLNYLNTYKKYFYYTAEDKSNWGPIYHTVVISIHDYFYFYYMCITSCVHNDIKNKIHYIAVYNYIYNIYNI